MLRVQGVVALIPSSLADPHPFPSTLAHLHSSGAAVNRALTMRRSQSKGSVDPEHQFMAFVWDASCATRVVARVGRDVGMVL
jgi:hypothetical protein